MVGIRTGQLLLVSGWREVASKLTDGIHWSDGVSVAVQRTVASSGPVC